MCRIVSPVITVNRVFRIRMLTLIVRANHEPFPFPKYILCTRDKITFFLSNDNCKNSALNVKTRLMTFRIKTGNSSEFLYPIEVYLNNSQFNATLMFNTCHQKKKKVIYL